MRKTMTLRMRSPTELQEAGGGYLGIAFVSSFVSPPEKIRVRGKEYKKHHITYDTKWSLKRAMVRLRKQGYSSKYYKLEKAEYITVPSSKAKRLDAGYLLYKRKRD